MYGTEHCVHPSQLDSMPGSEEYQIATERYAVYSENEPIIWLLCDRYRTARRAKQVAWSGEGIPHGFREDGARLKDLKVSRVWMVCEGEKHGFDEWWQEVSVTHVADLTEFFRIEPS